MSLSLTGYQKGQDNCLKLTNMLQLYANDEFKNTNLFLSNFVLDLFLGLGRGRGQVFFLLIFLFFFILPTFLKQMCDVNTYAELRLCQVHQSDSEGHDRHVRN